jgi:hypothetical protein
VFGSGQKPIETALYSRPTGKKGMILFSGRDWFTPQTIEFVQSFYSSIKVLLFPEKEAKSVGLLRRRKWRPIIREADPGGLEKLSNTKCQKWKVYAIVNRKREYYWMRQLTRAI